MSRPVTLRLLPYTTQDTTPWDIFPTHLLGGKKRFSPDQAVVEIMLPRAFRKCTV